MAGASVTKRDELFVFFRELLTISRTMTKFKNRRKKNPATSVIPDGLSKLTERDRRALKRIVGKRHRSTAAKMIAELNQHLNSPVSTKSVRSELNKS